MMVFLKNERKMANGQAKTIKPTPLMSLLAQIVILSRANSPIR